MLMVLQSHELDLSYFNTRLEAVLLLPKDEFLSTRSQGRKYYELNTQTSRVIRSHVGNCMRENLLGDANAAKILKRGC